MKLFKGFSHALQKEPLKVGIVGMGKMGNLRAHYIIKDPRMKLVAVCDPAITNMDVPKGIRKYHNYEDLLREDLDIVYACTVNWVLPDVVIAALKSGRHVFCEKPPGRNADDVRRIIKEERLRPKQCVYYGFNHRYHYSVMMAKELLDSGELGELLWMRGTYGKCGGENFANSWRNKGELTGGGILLDQGIHMLDLFHYFGFEENKVKSFVSTNYWNINTEDNAFILLSDGYRHAMLHSSATQWKHCFRLEIGLSRGFISLEGLNTGSRSYGEESIMWCRSQMDEDSPIIGHPLEYRMIFNNDDSWAWEQDNFIECIASNRESLSQEALSVMILVENIYKQN